MAETTSAASRHVCSVFESQTWRKSLCKHCFHSLQEHSEQILAQEAESVAKEKAEIVSREHAEAVAREKADKEETLHTLTDSSENVPEVDKNKKISSVVNGKIYSKANGLRDFKTERGFSFGSAKLKENVAGRKANKDSTSNARPGRSSKDVSSDDATKIISKDCIVAGTTKRVGEGVVSDATTRNSSVVSDATTKKTNKDVLNDATTRNASIVSNSTTKNTNKEVSDAKTRNSNFAIDATTSNSSKSVVNDIRKRSTSVASDATTQKTSKDDVKNTASSKTHKDVSGVGLAKGVDKERVKSVSPQTHFTLRTSKKQQQALPPNSVPSTSARSTSVSPTNVPSQSSPQCSSTGSLHSPPSTPVLSPPFTPVLSPPSTPVLSPTSPTAAAAPIAAITGTAAAGKSLTSKSPTPKSPTSHSANPKSPTSVSATPKSPISHSAPPKSPTSYSATPKNSILSQTSPNNKPFAISTQISSNSLKSSVTKTRIAIKSDSKAPVPSNEKDRRRTPSPFPFTLTLRREKQTKETPEIKSPSNTSPTIPQNQSRPDILQNDLKTSLTTVDDAKISNSHSTESKLAEAEASSPRAFGQKQLQLDDKPRNKIPLRSPPANDSKESDKSTVTCSVDSLKLNRDNSKSPTNSNELNKKTITSSVNSLKSAALKSTISTTNSSTSKSRLEKGGSSSSSDKHRSKIDRKMEECTQLDEVKGQTNALIKQEQSTVLIPSTITDRGASFIEAERDITRRRSSSSRRDSDQAQQNLPERKREAGTGRTVRSSRHMSSVGQAQTIVSDKLVRCPVKDNGSSAAVSPENQDQAKKEIKQAATSQTDAADNTSPAKRIIKDKQSINDDPSAVLCNGIKKADNLLLKKKESLSLSLSNGKRASTPGPISQVSRTSTPSTSLSSSSPSSPATANSPSSLSSVNSSKSPTSSTPDCKTLVNAEKDTKAGKSTKENSNTPETVKGKVIKRPTCLTKKGSTPFISQTALEKDAISCHLEDEDKRACIETKDSEKIKAELLIKEEELATMTKQMTQMGQLIKTLEEEKDRLKSEHTEKENTENVLIDLRMQLAVLENQCSRLEKENQSLSDKLYEKKATAESEQEAERRKADKETLKRDLQDTEKELEELKGINEELQDQIIELKDEMEEMYDHFRENDHEEFRDIQRELDMTAKNCRVLQLKLRKAERRNERIEEERAQYEERLRLLQDQFDSKDAKNHIRVLEEELRIAKGVSVRLHDELDIVEDKRKKALEDNKHLAELLEHTDRRQFRLEMEVDKLRDMVGDLKQQLKESRIGHTNNHKETSPDRRVVSNIFTRSID